MIIFLSTKVVGLTSDNSTVQWILADIQCDTASELPTYNQFKDSKNILFYPGSTAKIIDPRSTYTMKSDGTWIIQDVGNDYYSKAETDDLLDDKADKATTYTITETNTLLADRLPLKNGDYTALTTQGTWDLFTLPVGVYYRTSNVTAVSNVPSDLTSATAFFCIIQNTVGSNRRQILLYPCLQPNTGEFYRCLETGSGYGSWEKFTSDVYTKTQVDTIAADNDFCRVGTTIPANADLNSYTTKGIFNCGATNAATLSNCPVSAGFRMEVVEIAFSSRHQQRLYPQLVAADSYYNRTEGSSGYGSWYKYTGTVVT